MAKTAHHERECKLDAPSLDVIRQVKEHVLQHAEHFTPSTHLPHPGIPDDLRAHFSTPLEVTEPRIRLYWDDVDLTAYRAGIEIRQEPRPKGGVKQMVKVGSLSGKILDRMEHAANLEKFGLDFGAVKDAGMRAQLFDLLGNKRLKIIICMISQRLKMNYHPDGDPDTIIEMGIDAPCRGHTFDGFTWELPQIELELVQGGDEKILESEAAVLAGLFDLKPNVTSKPSAGFAHLKETLAGKEGYKAFESLKKDHAWWV